VALATTIRVLLKKDFAGKDSIFLRDRCKVNLRELPQMKIAEAILPL